MLGSHTECLYALTSYGIPKEILPVDAEGKFVQAWIESYVKERILIENGKASSSQSNESPERIQYPAPTDVLLGRGRPFQAWNSHLAELIEKHRKEYQKLNRSEKIYLAIRIVKMIKRKGGRFLLRSQDENGWVEASDSVARQKVSSGFRTMIKMKGSK